jgi:hypothetical protein
MSSWIKSSLPGEQNAASLGNHLFIYCAIHFSPNIGCEYGKDLVCKAERVPDPGRKAVFIRYFVAGLRISTVLSIRHGGHGVIPES